MLALNRAEILKYREAFYQPSNIILGVSGNFNEKAVLAQIAKTWGKLKNKKTPNFKSLGKDNQVLPRLSLFHKTTEQAHLAIGFKSYGYGNPKNPAALLLGIILGGNMSSRLFVTIREQKGLAYYVNASQSAYHGVGNFGISAGLRINQAGKALEEILDQLRTIRKEPVSAVELKKAKDFIKGKMALGFESKHRNLDWLIDSFANTGKTKTIEKFLSEIEKVKPADILAVAKDVFQNNRMSVSIVGPFKNKKEFTQKL